MNNGVLKSIFASLLCVLLFACGGSSSGGDDDNSPSLKGTVQAFYSDQPVANAQVSLYANGSLVAQGQTNNAGDFSIEYDSAALDGRVTLSATAQGYGETAQTLSLQQLEQSIQLRVQRAHETVSFDPNSASDLQVQGQTLVALPASVLVDAQGNPVEGNAKVDLTVIDPRLNIELMPGEMVTESSNGETVPIESFGAITVEFYDEQGNPLNIAEGETAQIRIPAAGNNPPATIPLYYFDPQTGLWVKEGEATLDNGFYVGDVAHFTTWNADIEMDTVVINGCVVNSAQEPVAIAYITAEGITYSGWSSSYSDENGQFSIPVRRDSEVLLRATAANLSGTQALLTEDTDLIAEQCIVVDGAVSTVTLTWGENPEDLDAHFYIPTAQGFYEKLYYLNPIVRVEGVEFYLNYDYTEGFGPEIITLPDFPIDGTYGYYVHLFEGSGSIDTQARVNLELENVSRVFVPNANSGTSTELWHVFDIVVTDGIAQVNEINQFVSAPDLPELPVDPGGQGPITGSMCEEGDITPAMFTSFQDYWDNGVAACGVYMMTYAEELGADRDQLLEDLLEDFREDGYEIEVEDPWTWEQVFAAIGEQALAEWEAEWGNTWPYPTSNAQRAMASGKYVPQSSIPQQLLESKYYSK
ncbi:carboxypeptidase regulatory-like domain-containing protein [Aliagarivorans marinus]|uniref:carboxypeptidase regulatory-like domain-containing protein n=1 Tax=Aliagarivorans marinus TaxID=561965 RepID=UPI00040C90F8|nr:carboxypeptidase regulatory-like domain-containing protein [Aliagarivorans marinus]